MITIFILIGAMSAASTDVNKLFIQANADYKAQNYTQALNSYQSILGQKKYSWEIYYNLGNTYYKLGDLLNARYAMEQALILNPSNKSIEKNIILIKRMLLDKEDLKPKPISKVYQKFASILNALQWLNMIVIVISIICILLIIMVLTKIQWLKNVTIILGSILIVLLLFGYQPIKDGLNPSQALVFQERIEVKSGPGENFASLFVLHQGAKVTVLREHPSGWSYVKFSSNLSGWVIKNSYKLITL